MTTIFEDEKNAEVNGRLIIASLQALEKEETDKAPKMQSMFSAGSIKAFDAPSAKENDTAVNLNIPGKIEEKKSGSLLDRLKFKKKKK